MTLVSLAQTLGGFLLLFGSGELLLRGAAAGRVSLSGLNVAFGSRLCKNADAESFCATIESGR